VVMRHLGASRISAQSGKAGPTERDRSRLPYRASVRGGSCGLAHARLYTNPPLMCNRVTDVLKDIPDDADRACPETAAKH